MRFFPSKQLFRILAILLALALTASACGSDGAEETSAAETADTSEMQDTEEPADTGDDFSGFSVVMILDGSAQDGGWNSTHVRGGDKVEAAFPGINIEYVEEVAPGQTATNAFQDAVDGGADVVIGTTYYQDDMMDVAAANLETTFLTWAGFTTADNVGHFDGASEDGRYLDGLVAGSLTKSGIIGYPVGFPFNEVNRAVNAFTIGVNEINPDAEVRVVYMNTWFDPALEQQAAEALANAGADVLAHEVASTVYATVMAENGGHVIGYTNDWSDIEPEAWASSFLYDWGTYYVDQIQDVIDDNFEPAITFGGLKDGFIDFAPYGPDVSDEILALIEERKAAIIDGSFDIFAGPINDNAGNEVVPAGGSIPFDKRYECCQWLIEGVVGEIPG
jgi:basic membrane protein A